MNASRGLFWGLGLVIIAAGVYLLYFQADLSRWVSLGMVTAGILLFVGLAVMSFASSAPRERPVEHAPATPQATIVETQPTIVKVEQRRRP